MKLTLIQPCIGRRPGEPYLRSWQMEPLSLAVLASLTPRDVRIKLLDDRLESIPYDEPTDLVALTVETYTAKRSYQIAGEYRKRGVPVVMGGFHPTLCSAEAAQYADSVVMGNAEDVWLKLIDDYRSGNPSRFYKSKGPPSLKGVNPDRNIFSGKKYLPIGLVEASRGCCFQCEFCSVGAYYQACGNWRPIDEVAAEMIRVSKDKKLIFLVDDNIAAEPEKAKELFRLLARNPVPWISQCAIAAAGDEEFLDLMVKSGCKGALIGFESLNPQNLRAMNKSFNSFAGGYEKALSNFAKFKIRIYGTFIFGYDYDVPASLTEAAAFAKKHKMFVAAFNHVVPFPGTPLYRRLEEQNRLLYDRWWLDERYRFNDVAFKPKGFTPEELRLECLKARRSFYSAKSIVTRAFGKANRSDMFMLRNYFLMNALHRYEIGKRDQHPLGDEAWKGRLLPSTLPETTARRELETACS